MRSALRVLGMVAVTQLLIAGAASAASGPLGGACKEITNAQAKRILGSAVKSSSGADRYGGRSLCSLSLGTSHLSITSEPAKLFNTIVASKRSDPSYARGFAAVSLGDAGYRWDEWDLGSAGRKVFNAHVVLFRVGNRMFTVSDEKRNSRFPAAARLAVAKVVAQNARAR